ncbi:hypothetical protein VOLCADRAFT_90563 [Volvox carteri f. nagariensis]|uniref:Uncharacterized protein n=1 Tax=Volvox carteri f. nagariensis TaxID=3068 RepID=D8TUR0_VOLCA|nr:uncharacterized protein VOLCADRAFT_90563 [Volvox carteri f. nagariensis]EFJ48750.1 hypothetical protein VOLCADRAFT_90563 [Volvox carteri f. nagariensis]|eukprot:XP_002950082.1 hypothetical protein VOLCADRAFT_90563 [Volvox carteri f. nagariensis]
MKNTVTNSAIGRGRNWKICVMNAVSRTTITSTFQRAMFRVSSVSRPMLGLGDMERRGDDMLGLGVQSKQVKQELMISTTFSVGFDGVMGSRTGKGVKLTSSSAAVQFLVDVAALQQRGRGGSLDSGAGAVGKLSAAAAAAAPAVRPLADFAFIRSAPKRRVSAGRTGMLVNTPSAPTGPMGSCCVEELRRLNWKTNVVEAQAPPGHTSRIDGGDADGSREGIEPSDGDSDDGSDEVVIKGSWHFGSLPRNGGRDAALVVHN